LALPAKIFLALLQTARNFLRAALHLAQRLEGDRKPVARMLGLARIEARRNSRQVPL
jgi:hypothetical protein